MDFLQDFKNASALYYWRNRITPDQYGPIEYPDKEGALKIIFFSLARKLIQCLSK